MQIMNYLRKPAVFVPLGTLLLVVVVGLGIWQYRKDIENQGEQLQERVEQTYKMAQNSLSTCLDQGRVAAQVADREFEQLKGILAEVVSARYVDEDGNPTGASEALGGGMLFSAVAESYPDIDQTSFQNLQAVAVGCRDEYQGSQDRVFNEVREFETWILTDNIFNQGIKNNFPSDALDVADLSSDEVLVGAAALNYMSRVILVDEAADAYRDGRLDEQDLFGDN